MFRWGPSDVESCAYGSKGGHVVPCESVEPVGCVAVGNDVIGKMRDFLAIRLLCLTRVEANVDLKELRTKVLEGCLQENKGVGGFHDNSWQRLVA